MDEYPHLHHIRLITFFEVKGVVFSDPQVATHPSIHQRLGSRQTITNGLGGMPMGAPWSLFLGIGWP